MSDRFDDLLSGAAETATRAANAPGAEAARRRGRQRRNRQRLAASTLSLALLGGAGGVAAVSLGNSAQTPVMSATGTVTGTAVSPSSAAPPSPSTSVSTSSAPPSSPSSSVKQGSTPPPSPGRYVAAGWLPASRLPYAKGYQGGWTADGSVVGKAVPGTGLVFSEHPPAELCNDELSSGNGMSGVARGAVGQQFRMYDTQGIQLPGTKIAALIREQVLFFPNSGTAQTAFGTLPADFAACKPQMTGYNPTTGAQDVGSIQQTLGQGDAQCWSTLVTATPAGSTGVLDHTCFVRRGTLIAGLQVRVNLVAHFSDLGFTSIDSGLVSDLRQALSAY